MNKTQSGFTLVEIAIVLVIIGLLLGGVLKGQELVNSAKVKNHVSDLKAVPLFVYGYQDKYKALPGDDANARNHLGTAALEPGGGTRGNGTIEGNYNSTAATDESVPSGSMCAWPTWRPVRQTLQHRPALFRPMLMADVSAFKAKARLPT